MKSKFELNMRICELENLIDICEGQKKALFVGKKERKRLAEHIASYKAELDECKQLLEKYKEESVPKKDTRKKPEEKLGPESTTKIKPTPIVGNEGSSGSKHSDRAIPVSASNIKPAPTTSNRGLNGHSPQSPFSVDTVINSKAKEIEQILKKYNWYDPRLDIIEKTVGSLTGLIFHWYDKLPQESINGEDYSIEINDGYIDHYEEKGLLLWKVKETASGKYAAIDKIRDRENILKILGISFTKSQYQDYMTFAYESRSLDVHYTLNLTIPAERIAEVWSIMSAIHLDRLLYHSNGWGEKMKNSEFARVLSDELFNYIIEFENSFDPRYRPLCLDLTYSLTNKYFSINQINWNENNYSSGITERRYDKKCIYDFKDMGYRDLSDEQVIAVKWIISMRVAAKLKEHGAAFVVFGAFCWLYPLSSAIPFFGVTVYYKDKKDNSVLKEW